jgi:hypothetical protein
VQFVLARQNTRLHHHTSKEPIAMPLTVAQLAARRRNAQKSTGPRRAAGKAKSRINALKHGQRAYVAFRPEDAQAIDRRAADLSADLKPQGPSEQILVRQIAWASLRLERLQTQDEQARLDRPAAAFDAFEAERLAAIASLLERLDEPDPLPTTFDRYFAPSTAGSVLPIDRAAILDELESTAEGCAELADLWDELLQVLDDPTRPCHPTQIQRLPRLLGHSGPVSPTSPTPIAEPYRAALVVALGKPSSPTDQTAFRTLLKQAASPQDPNLPTEASARESLRALAQSHIARVTARLEQLWLESDSALFTEAVAAANSTPDTSPEAILRHRYLAAATRDLHRAFNLLDRGRKSARLWTMTSSPGEPTPAPDEPQPTCHCSVSSAPRQRSTPAPNEPKPTPHAPRETPAVACRGLSSSPARQAPIESKPFGIPLAPARAT